jgi:putative lipoprotein
MMSAFAVIYCNTSRAQWGEPYTTFSSVLSAHLLIGYTFNVKDFYLTPAGGIGLSASIFGKSSFISFTVPIDLDIKYYFTRSVGISISGMGTFGIGSFITSSEMPVDSASAFFLRASMFHPISMNFAVKIGPTIRIPGQKGLNKKIRELQNKRR